MISLFMVFPLILENRNFAIESIIERDSSPEKVIEITETDLNRVDWKMNHFPNPGFELWKPGDPHDPERLSDWRTREWYTWLTSSPWPVSEGSNSVGIQARAIDPEHPTINDFHQSMQQSLFNPINMTMSFDWYVDENQNPIDSDYVVMELNFRVGWENRRMWYYLNGQETVTNTTTDTYFILDQTPDIWHYFDSNLTEDFYDAFGEYATEYISLYINVQCKSSGYIRTFFDDINFVNGTTIFARADFNGDWLDDRTSVWWGPISNYDPADISQSTLKVEGDWSLNATVTSKGNDSHCDFTYEPNIRLTNLNQDQLSFWWRIEDFQHATENTFSYLYISLGNITNDFALYYFLCYGGDDIPISLQPDYIAILVNDFNTTGTWNLFNRSIWDDVIALTTTDDLWVQTIQFHAYAKEHGSRISILLDDFSLISASLNDRDYEDQFEVGSEIRAWDNWFPALTVTNQSYAGEKAANLTVVDGDYFDGQQDMVGRSFNASTETYLDCNWRLDDFRNLDDEYVYFELYLDDGKYIQYFMTMGENTTFGDGENTAIIFVPNANTTGSWNNMQRNIVQDYVNAFGTMPDTTLESINLIANTPSSGRIEILFDDLYLYNDPAPSIENVAQSPAAPEANQSADVKADVIDPSLDSVFLHYRVDGGAWINENMTHSTGNSYEATIPGQSLNSLVEYYLSANDTFGKSTNALDGSTYFSYVAVDTNPPSILITNPTNESTVSGTVTITVDASDVESGINRVEIFIDSSLVNNDTASPYEYSWDTTSFSDDEHTILVKAFDVAGHQSDQLFVVTVDNTPTTTPGDLSLWLLVALAIAGIGVILLIMVIARLKMR